MLCKPLHRFLALHKPKSRFLHCFRNLKPYALTKQCHGPEKKLSGIIFVKTKINGNEILL